MLSIKMAPSGVPWLVTLICGALLAGCANLPPAGLPPIAGMPTAFRDSDSTATDAATIVSQPDSAWWRAFDDPVLDDLVERAGRGNTSIELAAARLGQARALLRAADASRAPQLGLAAGVSRQGGPLINAAGGDGTLASVGATATYDPDFFARLKGASQAATLDVQAREALLRAARLVVQAEVAQTYLALRALDAEHVLVQEGAVASHQTLRITEHRLLIGSVAELDLVRVRAEVALIESEALILKRRRAGLEHALAALIGELASNFQLGQSHRALALPVIPAVMPSTLLARRPDIVAAGSSLQAAQARLGLAKSAWLPNLALTAAGGYASPNLGELLSMSMRTWGVGALLSLPLLDGGRRQAGVQYADAELAATVALYREQVVLAFREVEDQLSGLRLLAEQAQTEARTVALARRATRLSGSRYRNGLASQLDLLDAQRVELRSRRQDLQVRAAQYQATVALVRALGGGWGAI